MSRIKEESLGEIIKKAIEKSGLKQSVIADRMGLKRQTINQIDRKKTFDIEFLQKLKDASGLDFTNYVFGESKSYPNSEDQNLALFRDSATDTSQLVEMSLSIRIKAEPAYVNKMGELIIAVKKEAAKLGFTIN
jgi:transcriptional regulator with XRE-family HTH domain